jgi:hypothetical protein
MKQETCRKKGKQEVSSAFLKKTRKKLLLLRPVLVKRPLARIKESFLLLFFKKEALSFLYPIATLCSVANQTLCRLASFHGHISPTQNGKF